MLRKKIEKFLESEKMSLHMPGHKGKFGRLDVTELNETDNLFIPGREIGNLLSRLEKRYGDKIEIMTNGSTGSMMTVLHYLKRRGKSILIPRGAHKSVFLGVMENDFDWKVTEGRLDEFNNYILPEVDEYIKLGKKDINLFIKPSYFGDVVDYEELLLKWKDSWTVFDMAHGSHLVDFNMDGEIKPSFRIYSTHKTLGSLNQGSIIAGPKDQCLNKDLKFYQTSSPSFPIITSIEDALNFTKKTSVLEFKEALNNFKDDLKNLNGVILIEKKDPFKLFFEFDKKVDALKISGYLKKNWGIYFEIASRDYLLGIVSLFTFKKDFTYLLEALKEATDKFKMEDEFRSKKRITLRDGSMELSMNDAYYRNWRKCFLEDSIGEIAGDFLDIYPPGIPFFLPGEKITYEKVELLKSMSKIDRLFVLK